MSETSIGRLERPLLAALTGAWGAVQRGLLEGSCELLQRGDAPAHHAREAGGEPVPVRALAQQHAVADDAHVQHEPKFGDIANILWYKKKTKEF